MQVAPSVLNFMAMIDRVDVAQTVKITVVQASGCAEMLAA